jgi:hypothetical protein
MSNLWGIELLGGVIAGGVDLPKRTSGELRTVSTLRAEDLYPGTVIQTLADIPAGDLPTVRLDETSVQILNVIDMYNLGL